MLRAWTTQDVHKIERLLDLLQRGRYKEKISIRKGAKKFTDLILLLFQLSKGEMRLCLKSPLLSPSNQLQMGQVTLTPPLQTIYPSQITTTPPHQTIYPTTHVPQPTPQLVLPNPKSLLPLQLQAFFTQGLFQTLIFIVITVISPSSNLLIKLTHKFLPPTPSHSPQTHPYSVPTCKKTIIYIHIK